MDKGIGETALQKLGDWGLAPMGAVESYWKKAIMISEGGNKMNLETLQKNMIELTKEQEDMIAKVNDEIDLYGFDYDNVPMWISNWGNKGGGLIKPFMKYPYKYAKMITNMATGAFDRTLPWNERAAKLMTLSTLMAIALAMMKAGDDDKETPDGSDKTPSALDPRGRMYIGTVNGKELFIRTAKYPFFNLASAVNAMSKGNFAEAKKVGIDQIGSLGPVTKVVALGLGLKNEYETYLPDDVLYAKQALSFVPGFRILNDVGNLIDPTPRKAENFVQGMFNGLPVFGDEETLKQWRGKPRSIDIPVEPETRSIAESETNSRMLEMYREDILMSMLGGVYITRIDPAEAKAQALREARNAAEETIRIYLGEGDIPKAQELAREVGFTIPSGTYTYYRTKKKKKN
jgi:hypothetical protein